MAKPSCVVIGDIHFTIPTLELATKALVAAQDTASALNVPLVINGDTLDTKSIIRGEVANRLISILDKDGPLTFINTGNHDALNEKSKESSLNFLRPYANVVSTPRYVEEVNSWIIPYQHDSDEMLGILNSIPKGSRLIIHQGVIGAWLGHYVQDKTSLPLEVFSDYRVIASHYHRAQDIKTGRPRKGAIGLFSYIGNPYSLSFGEANDGPKGFQILNDDGLLTQVKTKLRGHYIYERTAEEAINMQTRGAHLGMTGDYGNQDDLVWLKVSGPRSDLAKVNKKLLGVHLGLTNYKLDLIPTSDVSSETPSSEKLSEAEILDKLIDETSEPKAQKIALKDLWRELISEEK